MTEDPHAPAVPPTVRHLTTNPADVEAQAILEAVSAVLDGKPVSDFMESFYIVRQVADLTASRARLHAELGTLRSQVSGAILDAGDIPCFDEELGHSLRLWVERYTLAKQAEAECARLSQELEREREWYRVATALTRLTLRTYGQHKPECDVNKLYGHGNFGFAVEPPNCTCGFDHVLGSVDQGDSKNDCIILHEL